MPLRRVLAITAPLDPAEVGTAINASANFTDPGILDTHTAEFDWGDGTTSAGTVTESDGSGSVTRVHTYATAGLYTITRRARARFFAPRYTEEPDHGPSPPPRGCTNVTRLYMFDVDEDTPAYSARHSERPWPCHSERSEESLTSAPEGSFAVLRMTGWIGPSFPSLMGAGLCPA